MKKVMKIKHQIAISDTGFLFNPSTGESFTVNPVGAEIINLLRQGFTREQIIDEITGSYAVERNSFEKDLHEFAGIMKMYQLLDKDE
ncbi:MAG TPA: HPr-rel-A system PqqD family protein [Bacteroidales bacterium]|nr:HPr-rel-A system PqqD family protein [Bacteroidales bacterium]